MWTNYEIYKYGLSDIILAVLNGLGESSNATKLEELVFHCHVKVIADWLSEWLQTTLTFSELLEELCTYHIARPAVDSTIDFSVYPFLDDTDLGDYELYFYHPDTAKIHDAQTWMSIRKLQSLL